jgi:hypothetical protein
MSKRISIVLAIVLVLSLASGKWMSASARGAVVPFKGGYITHPTFAGFDPAGCFIQQITAEGDATHLGTSTFYGESHNCRDTWKLTGWMTFTADNGDLLEMSFSGTFSFDQYGNVTFQGPYTITGGTGRFAGSGGAGAYWGTASLVPGSTGEIYFNGTLEKP